MIISCHLYSLLFIYPFPVCQQNHFNFIFFTVYFSSCLFSSKFLGLSFYWWVFGKDFEGSLSPSFCLPGEFITNSIRWIMHSVPALQHASLICTNTSTQNLQFKKMKVKIKTSKEEGTLKMHLSAKIAQA